MPPAHYAIGQREPQLVQLKRRLMTGMSPRPSATSDLKDSSRWKRPYTRRRAGERLDSRGRWEGQLLALAA